MTSHRIRFIVAALVAVFTISLAEVAVARTFVVAEVFEDRAATNTFDTYFKFIYTGGQVGIPSAGNGVARVELYLYSDAGLPLQGQTGAICNPCVFKLSASDRTLRTSVEALAVARAGGLNGTGARQTTRGFAVISVTGDPDRLAIEASLVNKQSDGFTLSIMELGVQEVALPIEL
jgi:hypothetical protein